MPRYPFSPAILDALPEELAELFRDLELKLLEEICSRLKIADNLNEVTVQDIRALRSHGIEIPEIKKAIQNATSTGEEKLNTLLDDVISRNQKYYTDMIDLAHVTAPERLIDDADISAIRRQTWGAYKNITGSMGFLVVQGGRLNMLPPAKIYQHCLDSAAMQIQSGAISYTQAISEQVKQLADRGLCIAYDKKGNPLKNRVAYESGHIDHLDVAVRRAVMTGVNQLNQKYREQSMDYLGTDLVEVTAHLGARNTDGPMGWENHAKWQGKVYRWRKNGDGYAEPEHQMAPKPTPTPPAPIQAAAPAPVQPAPRTILTPMDVTQEYLDTATPGKGTITYDTDFDQSRHQAEVNFSKWLHKMFGGDIHLLDEVNKDKVQTPDYIWHGKLWDLKTATTEKAADAAIRHGLKQINRNPGGIFLDYRGRMIDLGKLQSIITSRMRHSNADSVDIVVILSDEIAKVFRYKK